MAPRNSRRPEAAPGRGRALVPSDRARAALVKRLAATTSTMNTAVLAAMNERHPWFSTMDADHRSWVGVVARSGIDGFVQWMADDAAEQFEPSAVFAQAPRALMRNISLHQTVELVRTTVAVVEEEMQHLMPRGDRAVVQTAIVHYSREVAFAAAEAYARAAELRGNWDARMEALVVDSVVRAEADEALASRASALGWSARGKVFVVTGPVPDDGEDALDRLRGAVEDTGVDVLAAIQGGRLVVVASSDKVTEAIDAVELVDRMADFWGEGHVVVGPLVDDLSGAPLSARAAISGLQASRAWPEAPRTVPASELLPERALNGDGHARRTLAVDVFGALRDAGGDLLETCVSFLDHGCSVEATARGLFVHANTVRYRLKRVQDVTGYSPNDARDAYVLRLAITLGRLSRS